MATHAGEEAAAAQLLAEVFPHVKRGALLACLRKHGHNVEQASAELLEVGLAVPMPC